MEQPALFTRIQEILTSSVLEPRAAPGRNLLQLRCRHDLVLIKDFLIRGVFGGGEGVRSEKI